MDGLSIYLAVAQPCKESPSFLNGMACLLCRRNRIAFNSTRYTTRTHVPYPMGSWALETKDTVLAEGERER